MPNENFKVGQERINYGLGILIISEQAIEKVMKKKKKQAQVYDHVIRKLCQMTAVLELMEKILGYRPQFSAFWHLSLKKFFYSTTHNFLQISSSPANLSFAGTFH